MHWENNFLWEDYLAADQDWHKLYETLVGLLMYGWRQRALQGTLSYRVYDIWTIITIRQKKLYLVTWYVVIFARRLSLLCASTIMPKERDGPRRDYGRCERDYDYWEDYVYLKGLHAEPLKLLDAPMELPRMRNGIKNTGSQKKYVTETNNLYTYATKKHADEWIPLAVLCLQVTKERVRVSRYISFALLLRK